MSFLPKMWIFSPSLSLSLKSMSASVRFNLASDDSKSISLYGRSSSGFADTISHQNKAGRPVWTLGDTWATNVAGHVSTGALIRRGDSQPFPICSPEACLHHHHHHHLSTCCRWGWAASLGQVDRGKKMSLLCRILFTFVTIIQCRYCIIYVLYSCH